MGAGIGRVEGQRVGGFPDAGIEEVEVLIDARETGATRRPVGIEQQPAAIDGPVVVQLDRAVELAQGLDRAVDGLQADGVVEVGRGVERIELLGELVLVGGQGLAPFLEIGSAEIGAQQRVARVQAHGKLEVGPALLDAAFADLCEAQAEARQRVGRVEGDRPLERRRGGARYGTRPDRQSRAPSAPAPDRATARPHGRRPRATGRGSRAISHSSDSRAQASASSGCSATACCIVARAPSMSKTACWA